MRTPVFSVSALLLAMVIGLSACGQTGPLYLPDAPSDTTKSDKKPSTQP